MRRSIRPTRARRPSDDSVDQTDARKHFAGSSRILAEPGGKESGEPLAFSW
jgi:hypothetical protein